MSDVFVVDAVRLASARSGGMLTRAHPAHLGAFVLNGLLSGFDFDPAAVDDVLLGCVGWSGWSGEPWDRGRRPTRTSGIPQVLPAVTIARRCASSQQALHTAALSVVDGTHNLVVAGGIASLAVGSACPDRGQDGCGSAVEHAEKLAQQWGLSREQVDRYALESHRRARSATESRAFASEILPLQWVEADEAPSLHDSDEALLGLTSYTSLASLEPFTEGGVLTSGNSSEPCLGAAAVLLASERAVRGHGLEPVARLISFTVSDNENEAVSEAPLRATPRALARAGLKLAEIDLFEVDEAFASVPLAWIRSLGVDPAKLNVHGGAIALGNPTGATGARLMTTLVHALRRRKKRYGLQALSEAGGETSITIVEAVP